MMDMLRRLEGLTRGKGQVSGGWVGLLVFSWSILMIMMMGFNG